MSIVFVAVLFIILSLQLVVLLALTSFAVTLFFGSPWVPTHPYRAKRMCEFAALTPGETVLDLGCGDGAILFTAVEEFGASKAIGYDINPLLLAMARCRAKLRRVGSIIRFERKNIFTTPLPKVDVVTTFLIPSTMKRLQHKFATELDPDTRIISRGFAIPGVTPYKKHEGPHEWLYLYRAGDLAKE